MISQELIDAVYPNAESEAVIKACSWILEKIKKEKE